MQPRLRLLLFVVVNIQLVAPSLAASSSSYKRGANENESDNTGVDKRPIGSVIVEQRRPLGVRPVAAGWRSGRRVVRLTDGGSSGYLLDTRHPGSWSRSSGRCRLSGHRLLIPSSRASIGRLWRRAHATGVAPSRRWYWIGGRYSEGRFSWLDGEAAEGASLKRLVGRRKSSTMLEEAEEEQEPKCLCLQLLPRRRYRLRLRNCQLRLPFLCETAKKSTKTAKDDRVTKDKYKDDRVTKDKYKDDRVTKDKYKDDRVTKDKYKDDRVTKDKYKDGRRVKKQRKQENSDKVDIGGWQAEDPNDPRDLDEPVDHSKFRLELPSRRTSRPQLTTTVAVVPNSTIVDAEYQQFEIVTLSVLYTVIAVSILVFTSLCLLQCCKRSRKMHYVRQVDTNDIPRFMPSAWA